MKPGCDSLPRRSDMSDELLQIANLSAPRPLRKPPWLRVRLSHGTAVGETRRTLKRLDLNTVCEEAACPNLGECWAKRHATVMILGRVCTRACAFCNVATAVIHLLMARVFMYWLRAV